MIRILFLILVAMIFTAFGQANQNEICPPNSQICDPKPIAKKFDEFAGINDKDFKKRLDRFFAELPKIQSDQGYIINYGSETEVANRENLIRESVKFCGYDASRITIVRGGEAKRPKTELWIVPAGAEHPKPDYDNLNRTAATLPKTFIPYRLEEFGEVSDQYFYKIFNLFFEEAKTKKTANGYIVIRAKENEAAALEERIKNLEFFQFYNSERIIFLRKPPNQTQATIALWFVPQSAEFSEDSGIK